MREFANSKIDVLASNHDLLDKGYDLVEYLENLNEHLGSEEVDFWSQDFICVEVRDTKVTIKGNPLKDYDPDLPIYLDMKLVRRMYTLNDHLHIVMVFEGDWYDVIIEPCFEVYPTNLKQVVEREELPAAGA